ncbi:MAG: hypothetical protein WAW37_00100 [Syntrophobacteraceae bacterium]
MDNPRLFKDPLIGWAEETLCLKPLAELGSKNSGKGLHRDEELFPGGKPSVVRGETATGDDVMDMGVIGKITPPCMENTDHGDAASNEFRVQGEFLQSFGRSLEEQIIDDIVIGPGKRSKPFGYGEGYKEVIFRKQQVKLFIEPKIGAVIAASGTVAVFAGVVAVADLIALATKIDVAAHGLRAAVFYILHGL